MKYPAKSEGFPGSIKILVVPDKQIKAASLHPLVTPMVITDIGFYPRAEGHFMARENGVAQAILIYCIDGAGWCELRGRQSAVRAGQILAIPPHTPHRYGSTDDDPWTIYWLHFTGELTGELLEFLEVSPEDPTITVGDQFAIISAFKELCALLESSITQRNITHASLSLGSLIGMISRSRIHGAGRLRLNRARAEKSITWMQENIHRSPSLRELADQVNLSIPHYSALFKQEVGMPPVDYFLRLKMQKACQLLDMTTYSSKEIAHRLGYSDPYYFSRVFKKVMDMPPTAYRKLPKG